MRPVPVAVDVGEFVVIQPGPSQARVVQFEPQRTHQVQARAGIGAQADDIARVGRDLGLVEDDVQHRPISARGKMRRTECLAYRGFPRTSQVPANGAFVPKFSNMMKLKRIFPYFRNSNS